jgi:hypothetical protein
VDQLGGGGGGARREVVLLDQEHAQAAAGGVAGDAGAVDAAAHDREVEIAHDSLRRHNIARLPTLLKPVRDLRSWC